MDFSMGLDLYQPDYSRWYSSGDFLGIDLSSGMALDFVNGRYVQFGQPITLADLGHTSTHSGDQLGLNAGGSYDTWVANEIARNNLGLHVVGTRTNIFLNSNAPASQTVTVVDVTEYTISVVGSGSVILTGAGTGTVTEGSPITLTTTTTALTCTVSGSLDYCNVEQGAFASPPITTAGSAVTRPGNQEVVSGLSMPTGVEFGMIADVEDLGSDYVRLLELNDGTANNALKVFCDTGNLKFSHTAGGVAQGEVTVGTFLTGLMGFALSSTTNYSKLSISGGAAGEDLTVTFPSLTKTNYLGEGIINTENAQGTVKEYFHRTNFTPDATSHAEMLTLVDARLATHTPAGKAFGAGFGAGFN